MIRVDGLEVRFGDFTAVRGVSFTVAEGACFGLVGESGSGKSSVLRALAGLDGERGGRIEIAGAALAARPDKAARRRVQMVFQDPYGSLHPRHTVDAALAECLAIHRLDRRDARIRAVLDAVGLGTRLRYRYPHQLSGGQRQRVAIARALILEPRVLLLDEPTSALDVSVQAEILNLLAALRAERRLTLVLVSHDLAVVAHLCEHIAVMRQGVIVETFDRAALQRGAFTHPYTRALWQASGPYRREHAAALLAQAADD
ncbi:peptide/nickel transport system ATP-binding protein [Plasticicumulans lactativorans]|uniref:Glutathione import ATP-binding protein GsiA n=1 Tax=Plasticicumulans lactativorans TaxID=1133106 RepID=A0A4R2LQ15_9GAMM|nr:ABC transporter ATP-binding protein [Plasticicumulans lactativorans]TCO81644.1 peptide/nickel transport system ATP-binding protein [Plasticicumulans lactativorans]